jgi:hypothetical protein
VNKKTYNRASSMNNSIFYDENMGVNVSKLKLKLNNYEKTWEERFIRK